MGTTSKYERYQSKLANIPAPGYGKGCHRKLLGVATLGIIAGCSDEEIREDIRAHIPPGARNVSDREIREAIERAHKDTRPQDGNTPFRQPISPPHRTKAERIVELLKETEGAEAALKDALEAGGGELDPFGADVREASPIRIEATPWGNMLPLLEHLYAPDDLLFIGKENDPGEGHIKTRAEWCEFFRAKIEEAERCGSDDRKAELGAWLGEQYPFIMPNPLTGDAAPTKAGDKTTRRGDACVKEFRYIVAECDGLSLPQQGALLRGFYRMGGVQIAALIYSGNKSCHAWLRCEGVKSQADWEREVKQKLFVLLTKLGFDGACANPARMSRLPGVFRKGKNWQQPGALRNKKDWQLLLYLAPKGECAVKPEDILVNFTENSTRFKALMEAKKHDRRSETSPENGKKGGRTPYTPEVWAAEYLASHYQKDGLYTLRCLGGTWYKYYGNGWEEWSENDVRSDVTAFLQAKNVTHISRPLINDMLENLKSNLLCGLDSGKYRNPCFLPGGESAAEWLPLRNKVINVKAIAEAIKRGEAPPDSAFMEHSPRLFMTGTLDYDYDPEATCPMWEKYLSEVQPKAENRRMLQMLAGLLLTWDIRTVAFFLLGDGGTGKSVFLNVLQAMLGEEKNCSCIPLSAFAGKFALAPLTKKRANIVDEMPAEEGNLNITELERNFKLVVAGGKVSTERKFQNYNGEGGRATARLVFATNQFPPFVDRSKAVWDRIRIIPFNQRIRGTQAENSNLAQEIASAELPGILNWAIHGLAELPKNGFPESPEGLKIKEEEQALADHEKTFLMEYAEPVSNPGQTDFIPAKDLYQAYCAWIEDNKYKPKAKGNFGKAVRRVFPNAQEDRIRMGNDRPYIWRNIIRKREI